MGENKDKAMAYMFRDIKFVPETKSTPISTSEQIAAISIIMADTKKKYSGPRRKAVKKDESINVSALPAHLQHLAR